jgi:hypothetical protein
MSAIPTDRELETEMTKPTPRRAFDPRRAPDPAKNPRLVRVRESFAGTHWPCYVERCD